MVCVYFKLVGFLVCKKYMYFLGNYVIILIKVIMNCYNYNISLFLMFEVVV